MANREAIAWYVEEAQRLLEEQQHRVESLSTRGGQIAGFGAVFLALIGGNAARVIHQTHGFARTVVIVVLGAAAFCLVVSVAAAVLGVSRRGRGPSLAADEIAVYLTRPFLDEFELWQVQVRSLRTLRRATEVAQENGDDALKSITVSLYAFLCGLGLAVVSVGVLIGELI
jgi:hypothetical protein